MVLKLVFGMICGCEDMTLKEGFSDLYGIACAKNAFVVPHLEISGGSNQWFVSFARAAHDWEVDVFASFFRVVYSVRVRWEGEDKLWWVLSKRGLSVVISFTVSWFTSMALISLRRVFRRLNTFEGGLFAWSAALGKILTMDNMKKWHLIMVDRCCIV